MTTLTLLDAVRADVRARFALIRTLQDIDETLSDVRATVSALQREAHERRDRGQTDTDSAALIADLVTLDTFSEELAERVRSHRSAVEIALFGIKPAAT